MQAAEIQTNVVQFNKNTQDILMHSHFNTISYSSIFYTTFFFTNTFQMSELIITIPTLKSCITVAYLYIQSINLKQQFHVSSKFAVHILLVLCHTDSQNQKNTT